MNNLRRLASSFVLMLLLLFPLYSLSFSETYFTLLPAGTDGSGGTSARYALFGDWPQSPLPYGVKVDESKSVKVGSFTYYYGSDNCWYAKFDWDYYKVEPIKWRVVTDNYDGNILLLAEDILLSIEWYDDSTADFRTVNGKEVYDNNYEYSRIRAYLNGLSYPVKKSNSSRQVMNDEFLNKGFLQTAFSEYLRSYIADTTVVNSPENSATESGFYNYNTAALSSCDNTIDKIFLLSRKEATTKSYGFGEYFESGLKTGRLRKPTSFANDSARYDSRGNIYEWWLRSPFATFYAEPLYLSSGSDGAELLQSLGVVVGEERNLFIENAMKYMGVPYVWGGTTSKGVDCSGLTYLAAQSIGIQIPRTSAMQYSASQHIKDSEKQPGDLVFFSDNGNTVTHVGIYIGEGKMLNAVSEGLKTGVVISSMDKGYWQRLYFGAGRIISDSSSVMSATQQASGSAEQGFSQDSPFFHRATHSVFTVQENGSMKVTDDEGAESLVGVPNHGIVPALCISSDFPTLERIEIASKPNKTVYSPGEELDLTGLSIMATYSDGKKRQVTNYTTSDFDSFEGGKHKLTVYCSELLVEKQLDIEYEVVLPVIEIASMPRKLVYNPGDKLELNGLSITAKYYNGTKKTITNYSASGFNTDLAGKHTLTINCTDDYTEQSFEIEYTVTFPFRGTFSGEFKGTDYTELSKGSNGSAGTKGRYVLFGDWPQTIKAANVSIDESKFVNVGAYKYYLGSDGGFYAKIAEDAYSSSSKYSDGTTIETGGQVFRYFKVEPIKWRIVTDDFGGNAMLLAENVLSTCAWYAGYDYPYSGGSTSSHRYIDGNTIYPNNYEYSTIRAYLNGLSYYTLEEYGSHDQFVNNEYLGKGFLQTAFNKTAQNLIVSTMLDNGSASTEKDGKKGSKTSRYLSEDTFDKIFLLSVNEATRGAYGLGDRTDGSKATNRAHVLTDFAKAMGARIASSSTMSGVWWLRSPSDSFWQSVYRVVDCAIENARSDAGSVCNGVVPALCIPSSMITPLDHPVLEGLEILRDSYYKGSYDMGTSVGEVILMSMDSLIARYDDGSSKELLEFVVKGFNSAKAGYHTLTISYSEFGVTKEILMSYNINSSGQSGGNPNELNDYKVVIEKNSSGGRKVSTSKITVDSGMSSGMAGAASDISGSTEPETEISDADVGWLERPAVLPERAGTVRFEKQAKAIDAAKFVQARISNTPGTGYTELPAGTDGTAGKNARYVLFGEWPQTMKEDYVVVDESVSREVGSLIYYLGSDGEWYCEAYSFYFKVEPIKWRILTDNFNGNTLLLAEKSLIDCQFYDFVFNRNIGGKVIYPNNYEHSKVRAYLNGLSYITKDSENSWQGTNTAFLNRGFLQTAFNDNAQKVIAYTPIDNSASSTIDSNKKLSPASVFACSDTKDKIFLLSEKEVTDSTIGMPAYNRSGDGSRRVRSSTDYLDMIGEMPYSDLISGRYWWLRSPVVESSDSDGWCVRQVLYDGNTEEYDYVNDCIDVVPALCVIK